MAGLGWLCLGLVSGSLGAPGQELWGSARTGRLPETVVAIGTDHTNRQHRIGHAHSGRTTLGITFQEASGRL